MYKKHLANVRKALKGAGKWHDSLSPMAVGLAAAMWQLDRVLDAMSRLKDVTYIEKTAYGEKIVPHPLFGMADKSQGMINRYCKTLGIVPDEIVIEERDDKLTELTRELIETSAADGETVRPR